MREKFGREIKSGNPRTVGEVEFQVESYLHHQGRTFSQVFDANTYVLMTRALDFFDPAAECDDDLAGALADVNARFLVVSFTSDWRFSLQRSREITDALVAAGKNVASAIVESDQGHDSFLMPIPRYFSVLNAYLGRLYAEITDA
jgi:homoserine O-acetyltransferase